MIEDDVAEVVRCAASGDEAAWNRLVEGYSPLLWGVARGYRLSTDECADAVQFAWLQLLERVSRIRHPERVGGWLVTTVRNECLRTIRRNRRERPTALNAEVADHTAVEDGLLLSERRAVVLRALAALDGRDQELLALVSVSPPVPYQEISRRMGMPIGSVGPSRVVRLVCDDCEDQREQLSERQRQER